MTALSNKDQDVGEIQCRKRWLLSGPALYTISANVEGISEAKQQLRADEINVTFSVYKRSIVEPQVSAQGYRV